jgi:tRNA threonylcarbamoyl adenosine modification protein (Sua5/YciO/YrdC/YwlC family)
MTRLFRVPAGDFDPALLDEAAGILRAGGIVAFPTETVYGLGVSSRLPAAVEKLARLKGRDAAKPFTYHLASVEEIGSLVDRIPPLARKLLDRYAPGPLTLVLPARGGEGTVGLRVPANPIARQLIARTGAPLLVPSANPAGEPPAVSAAEVLRYFDRRIEAVVDGGTALLKESSTVVRVDDEGYEVLRAGIITREMVHQLLEGRRILFVCTGNTCRSPLAAAIFQKHLAAQLGKSPEDLNELGYRVTSAGTFAVAGSAASEHAVDVAREMGFDLSRHSSRPISRELLLEVDHVYALSHSHHQILQRMIADLEPSAQPRLERLCEEGVTDPVGGDIETYRRCAREIDTAVRRVLRVNGAAD